MSYAGDLLQKAKDAHALSDRALGARLGVSGPVISQWRNGVGSPMPPERVIELCELAGVPASQRDYWLIGVQRDAVTITSVRRALDLALDRLRPAAAVVGLLALCAIVSPEILAKTAAYAAAFGGMPIMFITAWRKLHQWRGREAGHEGSTADRFRWHANILRA